MSRFIASCCVVCCLFWSACATKNNNLSVLKSANLQEIYFQKWIGGQEATDSGIVFFVTLSEELPKEVLLSKLQFRGQEVRFEKKI